MKLHENQTEFRELITLTAQEKHISESAVERDYYTVRALKHLADSDESDSCVFKGGTSLSKPNNRLSPIAHFCANGGRRQCTSLLTVPENIIQYFHALNVVMIRFV